MPGKHAPDSPASFYLSLARALGIALGAVVLVGGMGVALVKSGSPPPEKPAASGSPEASPTETGGDPSPTAAPTPRPHERVSVAVLNGARVGGLAGRTAELIEEEGYRVALVGNATTTKRTTIFYKNRAARVDAEEMLRVFPGFGRVQRSPVDQDARLRVVLGTDYSEPS